jgi:hypothetical protein
MAKKIISPENTLSAIDINIEKVQSKGIAYYRLTPEMKKFIIFYGLAGGFGGADSYEVVYAKDKNEASEMAYQAACETYESYEGYHGLRTVDDIMQEEGIEDEDYDQADEIYAQERESWLDYGVLEYNDKNLAKAKGYNFTDHTKN